MCTPQLNENPSKLKLVAVSVHTCFDVDLYFQLFPNAHDVEVTIPPDDH